MLLLYYGFKWKKENCIWRHPFVITDKGCKKLSFSNVRLTRTEKEYKNAGWHVTYCLDLSGSIPRRCVILTTTPTGPAPSDRIRLRVPWAP